MTNRVSSTNRAGRIWKAGLGLSLMLAGGFFVWWLWATWQKARLMDDWVGTEGLILESEVREWQFNEFSRMEYEPFIRYAFRVGEREGDHRILHRIRRVPIRSAHRDKARKWVDRYPPGSDATIWYDPGDPSQAVLKKDSKAALYSIWFPALFVAGGAGMFWTALRKPD